MRGRTFATADYGTAAEDGRQHAGGPRRPRRVARRGRAGCLEIGRGDDQIRRVNEEASAAAGISGIPTEEEHA